MTDSTPSRLLVLLSAEGSPVATAKRAATLAGEEASAGGVTTIDLVTPAVAPDHAAPDLTGLFERVTTRIETALPDEHDVDVRTPSLDLTDVDSTGFVGRLVEATDAADAAAVVVDPALTTVSASSLRETLGSDADVVVPPRAPTDGGRAQSMLHPPSAGRLLSIFLLSVGFYLALGWPVDTYEIVTGVMSGGVTAVVLGRIAMTRVPTLDRTGRRLLRSVVFVPVLLWEVAKANVVIAAIILRPSLPIEPGFVTVDADADDDFERATIANAITLTPGTLTVDVREDELHVHTLTKTSGIDLLNSRVPRFVRYVFRGRRGTAGNVSDASADDTTADSTAAADGPERDAA